MYEDATSITFSGAEVCPRFLSLLVARCRCLLLGIILIDLLLVLMVVQVVSVQCTVVVVVAVVALGHDEDDDDNILDENGAEVEAKADDGDLVALL